MFFSPLFLTTKPNLPVTFKLLSASTRTLAVQNSYQHYLKLFLHKLHLTHLHIKMWPTSGNHALNKFKCALPEDASTQV